ncbi:MAG: 50S ribosomal protein L11 methyltransferase [Clostridium sp.]|nr:50S ribosomal protein L11 methyltransferase [Clostridium sp.]
MNNYIETRLELTPCDETRTDLLAAFLADEGYESFVPDQSGLTAYIREELYNPAAVARAAEMIPLETHVEASWRRIEGRDWNEEWEKNYFKPIVIADRCVIHSSFHRDIPRAEYDIVIDPKMAFGTGHHSTTTLIVTDLLERDLGGNSVIDMGTGTGILAILAAMRGASPVTAIEIDPFAAINARENVALNNHPEITVIEGDASKLDGLDGSADLFLANINRNVITSDIRSYALTLRPGGQIVLSGFYREDIPVVAKAGMEAGLEPVRATDRENWACLVMQKS